MSSEQDNSSNKLKDSKKTYKMKDYVDALEKVFGDSLEIDPGPQEDTPQVWEFRTIPNKKKK